MSHLGPRLSALIDGELDGADRDRVLAHLARCEPCQREAAALRALKRRMHSLGEAPADADLTGRLLALPAGGGWGPWRPSRRGALRGRPPGRAARRAARRAPRRLAARRPVRYAIAGAAASVVIGIGAAAFVAGGSTPAPGPRVTPAVDVFLVQHAITTGQVPGRPRSLTPSPATSQVPPP